MSNSRIPTVSVIIPTFNRSQTIGRAIQSVLAQTFQDFEIIIVDDASTDGTKTIVEGLCGPLVRYLRHERNQGAAAARNTGISAAHGIYLAFLDSDDEWLPEKLSIQVTLLDDQSAGLDLSCSSFILVTNESEREYIQTARPDWFKRLLWTCDLGPGSTLVVRRECADRVGFLDEKLSRLEDWDWLLRLSKKHTIAVVEKPLSRIHRGPLPCADVIEASMARFLENHDEDFGLFGWHYRRRVIAKHWAELSYQFFREKRLLRGGHYLLKAFSVNPLQNPVLLMWLCSAFVDALLGTSISLWALERKHAAGEALRKLRK
ncbi:MAG TPA: glycosyltransferase family 2 protein [Thermodesulfovibrionales bacterium]|nr:glycosyltransferase family 2 protein [Thermodesulfovibrionales bacterium]